MDTSYGDFKLRHMGYTFAELQQKVSDAVASFPGLVKKINEFQSIELSDWQVKKFAKSAALVRFGDNVKVDINELLKVDRIEDSGNSLWEVFNRVQEKLINGDCSYTMGTKVRKARAIKNFSMDLKINEALWTLAEEYVK